MSKNLKAIQKSLDTFAPEIDDKTILVIDVATTDDYDSENYRTYTHTALYVNRRWYLTGVGGLLQREYNTTSELLAGVAKFPGSKVSMVTETEVVR